MACRVVNPDYTTGIPEVLSTTNILRPFVVNKIPALLSALGLVWTRSPSDEKMQVEQPDCYCCSDPVAKKSLCYHRMVLIRKMPHIEIRFQCAN
jgi:hypothetical protein